MLKAVDERNFQDKFKKNLFKNSEDRMPKKIILKEITAKESVSAVRILETSFGSKSVGLRKKNTINPGGVLKKKYAFFNSSVKKPKRTPSEHPSFTDNSKGSEMNENSGSAYASFENSKRDLISNNSVSRNDIIDVYDFTENDHIRNENMQKSSIRYKSPKLFLNRDKSESSNQIIQPSFAVNDVEIDNSEFSSSDFSFPVCEIRKENNPVMNQTPSQVPDSLKNDFLISCNDQMYHLSDDRRNEILSWILSCNQNSASDTRTMKFGDDGESSTDFSSSKYEKQTLADVVLENYYVSDVEMQTDSSTIPTPGARKFLNFTDSSFDSINNQPNFLLNLLGENPCSGTEKGKKSPYGKRQIQWHTCPDSLESALTTETEKLNEIKNYL